MEQALCLVLLVVYHLLREQQIIQQALKHLTAGCVAFKSPEKVKFSSPVVHFRFFLEFHPKAKYPKCPFSQCRRGQFSESTKRAGQPSSNYITIHHKNKLDSESKAVLLLPFGL